jgi:methyltransferase (TIGR00027 family)
MSRKLDDTWNLATSVGATATMVAAARAAAGHRINGDVIDPLAEPLVRAVGIDFYTRLASGKLDFEQIGTGWFPDLFTARTRFFDAFLTTTCRAGVRQTVNVAAGLDTRAYRLSWPAGTVAFEIDRPEVIEFKSNTVKALNVLPKTDLRTVGTDLRQDWPAQLRKAGFDPTQPTAWLLEGLLIGYLPSQAQDDLLEIITELSARGSNLAADCTLPAETFGSDLTTISTTWREHGFDGDLDADALVFQESRKNVAEHLRSQAWRISSSSLKDLYAAAGLDEATADLVYSETASIVYITAQLENQSRSASDSPLTSNCTTY